MSDHGALRDLTAEDPNTAQSTGVHAEITFGVRNRIKTK
jgi:hypothetical protein